MTTPLALLAVDDAVGLEELIGRLQAAGFRFVVAGAAADELVDGRLGLEPMTALLGGEFSLGERFDLSHGRLTGGLSVRWHDPTERAEAEISGLLRVDLLVATLPTTVESLGGLERIAQGPYQARAQLLRLAATNPDAVRAVVVDPADFPDVADALRHGTLSDDRRESLRAKAMLHVAAFDGLTHKALGVTPYQPQQQGLVLAPWPVASSRRMERLHDPSGWLCGVQPIELLAGPLPNAQVLLSLDAAMRAAQWHGDGATAATAIHGCACAFAVSASGLSRAMMRAVGADPVAASGGVLACRGVVDVTAARALLQHPFGSGLAVLAATDVTPEALTALKPLNDLLILRAPSNDAYGARVQLRSTRFGVFMRAVADPSEGPVDQLRQLGSVPPSAAAQAMIPVAMHACRQLASVGVALADGEGSIALCGGQPHVIDGIQIAAAKARRGTRPCVAVVDGDVLQAESIAALQRVQVMALVARAVGDAGDPVIAAADAAGIALLALPDTWASAVL